MLCLVLAVAFWCVPALAITKGTHWSQGCPGGISPIVDDPTAYMQIIFNRPQKRHCAPGTRFDPTSCMCSIMNEALPIGRGSSFKDKYYTTTVTTTTFNAPNTSPRERDFIGSVFGLSRLSPIFPLPDQKSHSFDSQQKAFFKTGITSLLDRQEILKSNKQITKQLQDNSGASFVHHSQDNPITLDFKDSVFDYSHQDVTTTSVPFSLDSIISNSNYLRNKNFKNYQNQNQQQSIFKVEKKMPISRRKSIDKVVMEQRNKPKLKPKELTNDTNLKNDITNLINATSTQITRTIFQIGQWGLGVTKIPKLNSQLLASTKVRHNGETKSKPNNKTSKISADIKQTRVDSNLKKTNGKSDTKSRHNDGAKVNTEDRDLSKNVMKQQKGKLSFKSTSENVSKGVRNKQLDFTLNRNRNATNNTTGDGMKNNHDQNKVIESPVINQNESIPKNIRNREKMDLPTKEVTLNMENLNKNLLRNSKEKVGANIRTKVRNHTGNNEKTNLGLKNPTRTEKVSKYPATKRNSTDLNNKIVSKSAPNRLSELLRKMDLQGLPRHIVSLLHNVAQLSSKLNYTRPNKQSSFQTSTRHKAKLIHSETTTPIPTTTTRPVKTTTTAFIKTKPATAASTTTTQTSILKNKISIAVVNKAKQSGVLKSLPFKKWGFDLNATNAQQSNQYIQMSQTNGKAPKQSNMEQNLQDANNVKPVGAGFHDGVFNIYTTTSTELPKKTVGYQIRPWLPSRLMQTNNVMNQQFSGPALMPLNSFGKNIQNKNQMLNRRSFPLQMDMPVSRFASNVQNRQRFYPATTHVNGRQTLFPTDPSPTIQTDTLMNLDKTTKKGKTSIEHTQVPNTSMRGELKQDTSTFQGRNIIRNSNKLSNGVATTKNMNEQYLGYYQTKVGHRPLVQTSKQNVFPWTSNLPTDNSHSKFIEQFMKSETKTNRAASPSKSKPQGQSTLFEEKYATNQRNLNKLVPFNLKTKSESKEQKANLLGNSEQALSKFPSSVPTIAKSATNQKYRDHLASLMTKSERIFHQSLPGNSKPSYPQVKQNMKKLTMLMEGINSGGAGQDKNSKQSISTLKPTTAKSQQNMKEFASLMAAMKSGGMGQEFNLQKFLNPTTFNLPDMRQLSPFMAGMKAVGIDPTTQKPKQISKSSHSAFGTNFFKNMFDVNAFSNFFNNPSNMGNLNSHLSASFGTSAPGETAELSDVIERSMEGQAEAGERATSGSNPTTTTQNPLMFNIQQNALKQFLGRNTFTSDATLLNSGLQDLLSKNKNTNKVSSQPVDSILQNSQFTKDNPFLGMQGNLFKPASVQGQNEFLSQIFGSTPTNTPSNWMSALFAKSKPTKTMKSAVNSVSSAAQSMPISKTHQTNPSLQSMQTNTSKVKQNGSVTKDLQSERSSQNDKLSQLFQNSRNMHSNNFQNFKTFQNFFNGR